LALLPLGELCMGFIHYPMKSSVLLELIKFVLVVTCLAVMSGCGPSKPSTQEIAAVKELSKLARDSANSKLMFHLTERGPERLAQGGKALKVITEFQTQFVAFNKNNYSLCKPELERLYGIVDQMFMANESKVETMKEEIEQIIGLINAKTAGQN
jgi:hypothetical protein